MAVVDVPVNVSSLPILAHAFVTAVMKLVHCMTLEIVSVIEAALSTVVVSVGRAGHYREYYLCYCAYGG
jgi:hypothetical protein